VTPIRLRLCWASLLAGALILIVAGGGDAAVSAHRRVSVSAQLPAVVRGGESITIPGRAVRVPAGSVAELQMRGSSRRWRVLAAVPLRGSAFKLRWHVQSSRSGRLTSLRVVVVNRGVILGASHSQQLLVGPAPEYCAAPVVPASLPPGDGVIVGGLYTLGGPAPGIDACRSTPYTITLTDAAGAVVLTQQVPGGQSYALVVPAGSYTLSGEAFCRGQATVTAGQITKADTDCDVP